MRIRAHVSGLVQGVGFRPFVARTAAALGLAGWVGNDADGVVLEAEGGAAAVAGLLEALRQGPPLSRVDAVRSADLPDEGGTGFVIRRSDEGGVRTALVPADTATCDDCLRELRDPADRRYRHAFLSCTACGPRLTIVTGVPYDRERTTMAGFPLCAPCQAEYDDPADRRHHAEPLCCPSCGPRLRLVGLDGDPVEAAARLLLDGKVLAVKGLGGYHLAADATQEHAVAALRARKARELRPFAVLVPDLAAAGELCLLDPLERELLTGPDRPIVLLRRRASAALAPSVAPGVPTLGLLLPYTPLHVLLAEAVGRPLVLTSGNASDEPIAFDDADALERLAPLADAFLTHDREIRTRVDDSVTKAVRGRVVPVRRSRGAVPHPVRLPVASPVPVLATGAALKSTFCLARGGQAFVSQHLGDLDDPRTREAYADAVGHLARLLDVTPSAVAHDLHPDYPSTAYAEGLPDVELLGVQHHHAHVASCLADNGRGGPVIGVAFDGTGLGTDGTVWGGEVLVADLHGFTRVAHLQQVPMPGGDAASRQGWRMAAAHLDAAFAGDVPAGLAVALRQGDRWGQVLSVARAGVNAPLTSSAGRLFDAVSALLGVCDVHGYEGHAAIALEHAADPGERGSYPVPLVDGVLEVGPLLRGLVEDLALPVPVLAGRFHNSLAAAVLGACVRTRDEHGLGTVALSGGVFQNSLLLERCLDGLEGAGFEVLTHRVVPCNDGGISLGQAAVAAALLSRRAAGG